MLQFTIWGIKFNLFFNLENMSILTRQIQEVNSASSCLVEISEGVVSVGAGACPLGGGCMDKNGAGVWQFYTLSKGARPDRLSRDREGTGSRSKVSSCCPLAQWQILASC